METELTADDLLVTLLTPPDAWREAIIALERLLYEAPLSASALEGARSERLEILAFEAGAPVRAFELQRTRLLLGPDARGARPAHGSPASVGALALADLEAFRASHLRAEDATFAAHGPVEAAGLASLLASEIEELPRRSRAMDRDGVPPGREEPLPPAPLLLHLGTREVAGIPPPGAGPAAWEEGARVLVDLELTSSWVSVAFPFPAGTPDLRLDFLAHLIREELSPRPPSPGLFRSDVSKVMIEDAPVLVPDRERRPQDHPRVGGEAHRSDGADGDPASGGRLLPAGHAKVQDADPPRACAAGEARGVGGAEKGCRPSPPLPIWWRKSGASTGAP